jgi:hypothetical protein
MNEDAHWKAIDQLREQCAMHAQAIAVIRHEQELQRAQNDKIIESMASLTAKMDALRDEVMQARGALKLGHWLVGILATTGAGAALLAWVSNNNGGA